ncbi:MAG: polysaccharide pyruvyl transferase family protein [Planctomycetota bacterium]|nr:polysaccharide pyruvyl transferase family protein [Planctomycetota bacterium]
MKAAILNYTGDHPNYGCQATSRELLSLVESFTGIEGEVSRVGVLRQSEGYEQVAAVDKRLREVLKSPNPSAADQEFLLDCCRQLYPDRLENLIEHDLFFFQPEGTLGGTVLHKGTGILLLPFVLKKIFGKAVVAVNGTVFSAVPGFERVIQNVFAQLDVVAVREFESYRFARSLGLQQALLWPDAAFQTVPVEPEWNRLVTRPVESSCFCVTGSAAMDCLDIQQLAGEIAEISCRTGLVPICILSTNQDKPLFEAVRALVPRAGRVIRQASYAEVAGVLAKARFLLGGRYHIAVLAAVAGTPFLSYPSNTMKMEGLHELLNWPFPVRRTGIDRLKFDVDSILKSGQDLESTLATQVQRVQQMIHLGRELFQTGIAQCRVSSSLELRCLFFDDQRYQDLQPELGELRLPRALDYYRKLHLELDRKKFGFEGDSVKGPIQADNR